jgi:hypothetical protein
MGRWIHRHACTRRSAANTKNQRKRNRRRRDTSFQHLTPPRADGLSDEI